MTAGETKYIACPDNWARLATLYAGEAANSILVDGTKAHTAYLACRSESIQFAYKKTTPACASGHPMEAGDYFVTLPIEDCWVKNEAAGTTGYLVITPLVNF